MQQIQLITFEQPLNESLRVCLKLELLFDQLNTLISTLNNSSAKPAIIALARILELIDRSDLSSRLAKLLTQRASSLAQLEQFPQVNKETLKNILRQLDQSIKFFHAGSKHIGQALRKNDFLKQLWQQLTTPGGINAYRNPAYELWLAKPCYEQRQHLQQWTDELQPLANAVALILKLTRESATIQHVKSAHGFYQQSLDTNVPCELIQVILPASVNAYPEFSVGKHRLTIRFMTCDYLGNSKPQAIKKDIEFTLKYCRV